MLCRISNLGKPLTALCALSAMQLGYRMSKAALNIAGVTIAGDLKKNQVRAP